VLRQLGSTLEIQALYLTSTTIPWCVQPAADVLERVLNECGSTDFRESGETAYQGPVTTSIVEIGGRAIRIVRPADPDRLLDEPTVLDWNRRDDYMPYWAYLWPGAYLLAETVMREPWPDRGVSTGQFEAIEIGCGLGLAGLAALARGRTVVFTDYDQAPLDFVARSASENAFDPTRFAFRRLDWRDLPGEQYPLILGADVIYEAPLVPLVANLLAKLLAPGGLGLIATPYRVAAEAFPAAIARAGLACRAQLVQSRSDDGRLIHGTVYRITRNET
jgi:predicted nicotinamide N-methyase